MLGNYENRILSITEMFSRKQLKKTKISSLISLSNRLKDLNDSEVESIMFELRDKLQSVDFGDKRSVKGYLKQFALVREVIKKKWDFHERESLISTYMAIGVAFGPIIGPIIAMTNPENLSLGISVGIPVAMAIGASIGYVREKQLDKAGKLY